MVTFGNLEYSRQRRRWVGYCGGSVYHVRKRADGWCAYKQSGARGPDYIPAERTLSDMACTLSRHAA